MANINELNTATLNGLLGAELDVPSTDPESPDYSVSPCDDAVWSGASSDSSLWTNVDTVPDIVETIGSGSGDGSLIGFLLPFVYEDYSITRTITDSQWGNGSSTSTSWETPCGSVV